jgi:hypothetical protein
LVAYAFEHGLNLLMVPSLANPAAGIDVIAYRGEGLIDLVDKRGHNLTEFSQALNVGKFRL